MKMHVVTGCPSCGNPIYGVRSFLADRLGAEVPAPRRTCVCPPLHVLAGYVEVPNFPPRFHHGDGDEDLPSL